MTKFKEFEERKREVSRRGKGDGNPIPMVKKETEISSGKGSWDMSTDRRGTAIVINLFPMYWLPAKRDAVIDMWLWILPPRTFYRFHHLSTADATTYTTTCLENRVKDFRSVHNSAKLNVIKPRWNINFHVPLQHGGPMKKLVCSINLRSDEKYL